ncbi:hypothetical protein [Clostridium weizhouense]|nr:hypothetical protein [Clostridium weizhouense]
METIKYKIWYYETAIKAGTEEIHKQNKMMNKKMKIEKMCAVK